MPLKNKTAVITGSSRGIGKEIALLFAKGGANIVLNGVQVDSNSPQTNALSDTIRKIASFNKNCIYVQADISKVSEVNKLVDRSISTFGKIDILVNNAGISPKHNGKRVPIVDLEKAEWDRVLDINLGGVFLCTRAVLPHMIKRRYGKIVNISSVDARTGGYGSVSAHYAASKGAVITFTKTIAGETAAYGINANCIAPGAVETEMMLDRPKEILERIRKNIPVKRFGKAIEIAQTALFLASDTSNYITGVTLDVNGGRLMV